MIKVFWLDLTWLDFKQQVNGMESWHLSVFGWAMSFPFLDGRMTQWTRKQPHRVSYIRTNCKRAGMEKEEYFPKSSVFVIDISSLDTPATLLVKQTTCCRETETAPPTDGFVRQKCDGVHVLKTDLLGDESGSPCRWLDNKLYSTSPLQPRTVIERPHVLTG